MNNPELYLQRIRLYKFSSLISYLIIRWQVFITEDQRKFFVEFNYADFSAQHYLFFSRSQPVGMVRLIYKNDVVSISRVAILKKYRAQGYATKLMHQTILLIKSSRRIN